MVTNTEPTAVLVLYRLFVISCVLTLGCSAAADTAECSACTPVDGQCPPGFIVSGDCNCVCGSEGNVLPIDRCDDLSCRAYLRSGYWAGYVRHPAGTNGSRLELYTGKCPSGFCESGSAPLLLPGLSNLSNLTEDLNQVVCGATRKGLLCGECSPGFGPGVNLFLAPCVHCATDPLSQVGWLLWLLLEALPLLLMLAAFLVFDINLLAGPLNSYLLYVQFVNASWPISSIGPITINNTAGSVVVRFAYIIFFGMFNLQFFSFLFPVFCISSSAAHLEQLDVIVIKVFTRLLPITIILAIIALQWCNQYGYCGVPKCWHYLTHRFKAVRWLTKRLSGQSAAHGLSAFIILTFTRFLTYGGVLYSVNTLEPSNPVNASPIHVMALQGNHEFFKHPKHIIVALAFLLLIIFTVFLPTFLLLVYPALPQLQAKLQQSKYRVLRRVSGLKYLSVFSRPSIQQFGDLFQSSYKDSCRFFAGVLLLVWIVVVVVWNVSSSREEGYVIMTALSLLVLTLHSLLRPHRSRWINVVDSLMYTHLTAINILAVHIYANPVNMRFSQVSWMALYQFALFAPGVCVVLYLVSIQCKRWRRSRKRQRPATSTEGTDENNNTQNEHVLEIDLPVDEDPRKEEDLKQEMETSFGNENDKSCRHQELWFKDK